MKDHFFELKNIIASSEKNEYHQKWNKIPELVASTEIANSAKHFLLRENRNREVMKIVRTRSVQQAVSGVAHIFVTSSGEHKILIEPEAPDYKIELLDGRLQGLYEFMDYTTRYWQAFLVEQNVLPVKQSDEELIGFTTQ